MKRKLQDLVQKSSSKDRETMLKFHDYMLRNNYELYLYLDGKGELENFLITRTDQACDKYWTAVNAGFTDPEECQRAALYRGVENSVREYVESMLIELPAYKARIEASNKYDGIIENLVTYVLDVFYKYINQPFAQCQENLDRDLLKAMRKRLKQLMVDGFPKPKHVPYEYDSSLSSAQLHIEDNMIYNGKEIETPCSVAESPF